MRVIDTEGMWLPRENQYVRPRGGSMLSYGRTMMPTDKISMPTLQPQ
jgi:hypothetical protein